MNGPNKEPSPMPTPDVRMISPRPAPGPIGLLRALAVWLLIMASAATVLSASGQAQPAARDSEAALADRIATAYNLMQKEGSFDDGYAKLRAALADAAKTDLYTFTVTSYSDAGATMYQNQILDKAEEILAEGIETKAMQEDVRERADFYLNYAIVKRDQKDYRGMVSMFALSTNLYSHYYGNESSQLMYANDLLAISIAAVGNIASAMNIEQRNLEIAERVLGPDDRFTWTLQNNLADMLRQIGAPSRALGYDLNVLSRRIGYYGANHFNVLVSASNVAQDYLDLGDYPQAVRYFQQDRDIAVALNQQGNLVEQADAWILYTQVLMGTQPLDDQTVSYLDPLISDVDYPDTLSIKIAHLLAGHFAAAGDAERSMKHLEQAYHIAGSTFGLQHPLTFAAQLAIATAKAKTDTSAAAADFASLDHDMIFWSSKQIGTAGSRVVAEASRALADEMLYAYAQLAAADPAAVPAFADAARRWPTLEDGKRDTLRKLTRLIEPNDLETRRLLQRAMRLSYAYQEVASSGEDFEAHGQPLLDALRAMDDSLNARLAEKYGFTKADLDKPLPLAQELLGANEALVDYFITRKWRADRESADPLEDVRLYAIVTRGGVAPRLFDLGDLRTIVPAAQSQQLAGLRSTRSSQERGAVPLIDLNAAFAGLYGKLLAPLEPALAGADTLFVVPDGKLFAVPFPLLQDSKGAMLEDRFTRARADATGVAVWA